ncbi:MAG TPA: GNAT family N-acetyltransferase [Oculatellaceae cyanobacterium]|jgi:putative acetyltransferase
MTTHQHLNFTLRPPKADEGPQLHALITEVLAGYGLPYTQEPDDRDFDNLVIAYGSPRSCFWVVEDENGRVLGCGGLKERSSEMAEVRKLYLHPDARGKGLGKRLLQCIIDFARAAGYRVVMLETSSKLPEACKLYERFGFQGYPHNNEVIQCDLRYELVLKDPLAVPTVASVL